MKRILIACAVIACGAGLAIAASPEVEKAIKTIQSATADPAKLKLFCEALQEDDDDDNNKDAQAEKDDPAEEKQAQAALKQLGADFAAAWAIGEKLGEDSADATEFASAMEAISAKCPQ
jgi:hypothetical protein